MPTIVVRLDPRLLDNPDADIRYRLPGLLVARSAGAIRADGYDYVGDGPLLVLFLTAAALEPAVACVVDVIESARVLGNDLRPAAVVAVEGAGGYEVVYPPNFTGSFSPPAER